MTTELITALFGGIALVITALGVLIRELKTANKAIAVTKELSEDADKKLDNAAIEIDTVKILVDGRYGEVLKTNASLSRQLADLKMMIADWTGKSTDRVKADLASEDAVTAQNKFEDQQTRITKSEK